MPLDPRESRRLENVRILLRTLNDIYPGPSTLRQQPVSGPAPGRRVPCKICNPASRPPRKALTSLCSCDGDGWRKRRRGDLFWDEVTGSVGATDAEPKKAEPMSPERLESEIGRIEHTLRLHDGGFDPDEKHGWERQRERRDQGASYVALERVLDRMQIERPVWRSYVTWVYFDGFTPNRVLDELVVGWIAARMPAKIRIPAHVYRVQQQELREEIRRLAKSGATLEQIALEVGVGLNRVRTVLAGTMRVSAADESAALGRVAGGTP